MSAAARVATLLAAALLLPSAIAEGDERCAGFRVAGITLGTTSDAVRVALGRRGTPLAVPDREPGATLLFELEGRSVEVEFDRRPRRRRPGRVVAVRERRSGGSADASTIVSDLERRLGRPEGPSTFAPVAPGIRERWSDDACNARLELAIEDQIDWWQPVAGSVVVTLRRIR